MSYTYCRTHKLKPVFGCEWCIKARGRLHITVVGKVHELKRKLETIDTNNEESVMDFLDEIEKFMDGLEYGN